MELLVILTYLAIYLKVEFLAYEVLHTIINCVCSHERYVLVRHLFERGWDIIIQNSIKRSICSIISIRGVIKLERIFNIAKGEGVRKSFLESFYFTLHFLSIFTEHAPTSSRTIPHHALTHHAREKREYALQQAVPLCTTS